MEQTKLKRYNYLAAFFAGFFACNVLPHFINGVSGNAFPSPFATPPWVWLSSPEVNVMWWLTNIIIAYVLLRSAKVSFNNTLGMCVIFLGIAVCGYMTSISFGS